MPTRWLLAGALGVETAPIMRRMEAPRPVSARLVVGSIAGQEVAILTCGVGRAKATERTAAALARWPADHVVSIGTCGALLDGMDIGDVITGSSVLDTGTGEFFTIPPLPGLPSAVIATVDAAVFDPEERARLADQGAAVCEMEAAGVAAVARKLDRPFSAIKVVSDFAGAEEDPVIGSPSVGSLVHAARVARFKARALRLVESHLAPAIVTVLEG